MATFNHLLIPSFIFNLFLMRINDYFMPRSTKGIDNEINIICSPHPLESLESPTTFPNSQSTLLVNKTIQDSSLNCSRLSWSWTLPIGLADMEEQEKKAKSHKHQERKVSIHRRQCTPLLIVPMKLIKHFQPEGLSTIPLKMCLQSLQELHTTRRKWGSGRNGCGSSCYKETLCKQSISHQLLWYHSLLQPMSPVPKVPSTGCYTTHQGVVTADLQERTGEEFKTFGLWYGVTISSSGMIKRTKVQWQNQTWTIAM